MADSLPLGSVEVEVKANLDKLRQDFAKGRAETQAFAADTSKVTAATKLSAAEQYQLAQKYNQLIATYNPLHDKMARYKADLASIAQINQSKGMFTPQELAKLNAGVAAFARTNKEFAAAMGTVVVPTQQATEATGELERSYQGLLTRYMPLQAARQKYITDTAAITRAEKAGIATSAEANAMRMAAAQTFANLETELTSATTAHVGWARSFEHHLRAVRLIVTLIGVDLALRLGEMTIKLIEQSAALKDQAAQLGITTDQLQEYNLMAKQVGMTSEDMASAFTTLNRNIQEAALGRIGPFSKMLEDFFGKVGAKAELLKPVNQIFLDLIDKIRDVGNEAQKKGALVISFGEAGQKMGQMAEKGSTGINRMGQELKATGQVMTPDQINKFHDLAEKMDRLWGVLTAKIKGTVAENAGTIADLAEALAQLAGVAFEHIISSIGALVTRVKEMMALFRQIREELANEQYSLPNLTGADKRTGVVNVGGVDIHLFPSKFSPLFSGQPKQEKNPPFQTVKLPEARPADKEKAQPHGPNQDLSGLLSPKGPKGRQAPLNEFEREELREQAAHLQLMREATGNLEEQNAIDKQLIDIKTLERFHALDDMVKRKTLTAAQAKQLKSEEQANADLEKEAADRKMRMAQIEQSAQAADEMARLEQDGLQIARVMARSDEERKKIDAAILDSKQQQAVYELQKEIALAQEAKDESRVLELTGELVKLRANQLNEWKAFDVEHLTGIDLFKHNLPENQAMFADAIKNLKFDLFNEKLQQAAQFADDIGSAFGKAAGALARFENPLDVLRGLLTDLADTFTKNFIEKPVEDWATAHLGLPLAKQGFGKDLEKLGGLTEQQFNTALVMATGSLNALQAAAMAASGALGGTAGVGGAASAAEAATNLAEGATDATSAMAQQVPILGQFGSGLLSVLNSISGGGGGGMLSGILGGVLQLGGSLLGGPAGSLTSSGTGFVGLEGLSAFPGFDIGGFTGPGNDNEIAGVVHRNEYVFDATTTRRLRPVLEAIGSGRIPGLGSPMGGSKMPTGDLHLHVGQFIFPGVTDARSARASASQATTTLHRGLSKVIKKGLSTSQ